MNSTRFWVHEPTDELLMGVSAVEEHRQLGLLRQVELLLKISDPEQKEGEEHKEKNKWLIPAYPIRRLLFFVFDMIENWIFFKGFDCFCEIVTD